MSKPLHGLRNALPEAAPFTPEEWAYYEGLNDQQAKLFREAGSPAHGMSSPAYDAIIAKMGPYLDYLSRHRPTGVHYNPLPGGGFEKMTPPPGRKR